MSDDFSPNNLYFSRFICTFGFFVVPLHPNFTRYIQNADAKVVLFFDIRKILEHFFYF